MRRKQVQIMQLQLRTGPAVHCTNRSPGHLTRAQLICTVTPSSSYKFILPLLPVITGSLPCPVSHLLVNVIFKFIGWCCYQHKHLIYFELINTFAKHVLTLTFHLIPCYSKVLQNNLSSECVKDSMLCSSNLIRIMSKNLAKVQTAIVLFFY